MTTAVRHYHRLVPDSHNRLSVKSFTASIHAVYLVDWLLMRPIVLPSGVLGFVPITSSFMYLRNNFHSFLSSLWRRRRPRSAILPPMMLASPLEFRKRLSGTSVFQMLKYLQAALTGYHLISPGHFAYSISSPQPNIYYEVRYKGLIEDLDIDLFCYVRDHLNDQCGVIYCHKTDDCDSVAKNLRGHGLIAEGIN